MKITTDVSLNLTGFEALRKGLSANQYVAVGIFGDHKAARKGDDEISNPELAIVQQFGSVSNNIPARPFIDMPIREKRKDILAYAASKQISDLLLAGNKKKALGLLGLFAENVIQKAFDTGGFGKWAPNAPRTVAQKKSSKPLINTTQLRRAIWSKVVGVQ